jgi:hypothetical protein
MWYYFSKCTLTLYRVLAICGYDKGEKILYIYISLKQIKIHSIIGMGRYSKMPTTQLTTDSEFLRQMIRYLIDEHGDKFDPTVSEIEEIAPKLLLFHANVRNGVAQWSSLFADISVFRPNGGLPKDTKVEISPACKAWKLTEGLMKDLRQCGWSLYFTSSYGEDNGAGDERYCFSELESSFGPDLKRRTKSWLDLTRSS